MASSQAERALRDAAASSSDVDLQTQAGGTAASYATSGGNTSITGGFAGSLPYPGRSYYKFRASAGPSKDALTPASLVTASHLDIREGSARLASLGLSQEDEDDSSLDTGLQPGGSRRASTSALLDAHTPSGLSMLLNRHEGRRLSPVEDTSPPDPISGLAPPEAAIDSSSDEASETTPLARSPQSGPNGGLPQVYKPRRPSASSARSESRSPSRMRKPRPSSIPAALSLPTEAYSERSPLLRGVSKQRKGSQSTSPGRTGTSDRSRSRSSDRHAHSRASASWAAYLDRIRSNVLASAAKGAATAGSLRKYSAQELAVNCFVEPVKTLPAVVLGILMNLLDGVSYGMIMFPVSSPVFTTFGGVGVSMFFASCFVSQLIFSSRSIFKGGNGSMMIEIVPFLHVIAFSISDRLGGIENSHQVIATTMAAYALTSLLTGLTFFLLGYLRLGAFVEFFPRVVLVGCIGGVGAFLVITGVQVCAGLENEKLEFSIPLIKRFFETDLFILWFIPLVLAAVLRIITSSRFNHPLVVPAFFIAVPVVFYIIVLSARIPMQTLRDGGWIFNLEGVNTPWYEYFTLYDFKATNWAAITETIPTQLALVFFALLHVPINVPALALSVGEDNVETDNELVNHGLSNFLSGCVGSIPNYLVYTNSVLFYRVGGTTRLSSFMLAAVTLIVFLIGPWVIGYLPVMIVGTLIYILGYDLLKEAIWDTFGRVSGFDYTTIWIIVLAMTYFDFVAGIGVGILVACVSFVIVSSQRQPIRAIMSGATATSTVRRHPRQSAFLRQVGTQVRIIKLQGFLFFGTVVKVEASIRNMLDAASWKHMPIRYLILDFSLGSGVDFSAAEAFLRIQRLLESRDVGMIVCGCDSDTPVGKALEQVDLFRAKAENPVHLFDTLNDSLEYCENSQLRSLYTKSLLPIPHHAASEMQSQADPIKLGVDNTSRMPSLDIPTKGIEHFSPRRAQVFRAGQTLLQHRRSVPSDSPISPRVTMTSSQPIQPSASAVSRESAGSPADAKAKPQPTQPIRILTQALSPYAPELTEDFFARLVPYFSKHSIHQGISLWNSRDVADAFYVLESGILRAVYDFPDTAQNVTESMLPGTIAGEMTFLAGSRRNATVIAERDCQLWRMDVRQLADLEEKEAPAVSRALRQVLLRISAESADVLMFHLLTG